MRVYDQGAVIRVTVSASEVYYFNQTWPCSTLSDTRGVSFTFKKNGDLVDLYPGNIDGPEVAALADDAKAYAIRCGKLSQ